MRQTPTEIFEEYKKGTDYKSSIGTKGLYEQGRINERFFIGDQWHGAKCGNDRPLVRHNVIKRIGNYKMSQLLGNTPKIVFSAQGVPAVSSTATDDIEESPIFSGKLSIEEVNHIMSVFGNYYNVTAERVKLDELNEKILRKAYICGTAVLYTYWDNMVEGGIFLSEDRKLSAKGDICCEVLDIEDIVFSDPFIENVQNQPYIIISSVKECDEVIREARINGADLGTLKNISEAARDGKITVLTKLYKEYKAGEGYKIKGVKVIENCFVRKEFDTMLTRYPISIFCWERKNGSIYGESEITYLIPNQIAINRMITANVWSTMTSGMPIMVVNGDTVTDKITNDPGQIIKVFGSNEDVAGAVKYITPPSFAKDFDTSINTLIENTLTQSGANEVALGDSRADNATALMTMREAALMPLEIIKNRFHTFLEDTARIWVDFWINYYGKRSIELKKKSGSEYMEFDSERYKGLAICAKVDIANAAVYSDKEKVELLISLFEKGIINRNQLLLRLPEGMVADITGLVAVAEEEENERI